MIDFKGSLELSKDMLDHMHSLSIHVLLNVFTQTKRMMQCDRWNTFKELGIYEHLKWEWQCFTWQLEASNLKFHLGHDNKLV